MLLASGPSSWQRAGPRADFKELPTRCGVCPPPDSHGIPFRQQLESPLVGPKYKLSLKNEGETLEYKYFVLLSRHYHPGEVHLALPCWFKVHTKMQKQRKRGMNSLLAIPKSPRTSRLSRLETLAWDSKGEAAAEWGRGVGVFPVGLCPAAADSLHGPRTGFLLLPSTLHPHGQSHYSLRHNVAWLNHIIN